MIVSAELPFHIQVNSLRQAWHSETQLNVQNQAAKSQLEANLTDLTKQLESVKQEFSKVGG
jgi:hypothetical protein